MHRSCPVSKFEIATTDLGISGYHWLLHWSGKGVCIWMRIVAKGKSEFGKAHDSLDALKHSQENNT